MYSIVKDGEYYLCSNTGGKNISVNAFININFSINPLWQKFDDVGFPYINENRDIVYKRIYKLSFIYTEYNLEIRKLTPEQIEFLILKKLKYNY